MAGGSRAGVGLLHSNAFEQFREGNLQGLCNPVYQLNRDILLAPLDSSHVAPVEAALVSKPFLGKALFSAQVGDALAKFFLNLLHSRNCPCMLSGQSTTYRETTYRVYTSGWAGTEEMPGTATRTLWIQLFAILLPAGMAPQAAADRPLQVSFEYANNRNSILLHVQVNEKPAVLILDTGSPYTVLRAEFLGLNRTRLGLTPLTPLANWICW